MKRPLEVWSTRVAVSVKLAIRLFDEATERDMRLRPAAGPSAMKDPNPTLAVISSPGADDYRRVWTVAPPRTGASPQVAAESSFKSVGPTGTIVKSGDAAKRVGFEDEPAPPDLGLQAVDAGQQGNGPVLLGTPGDETVVFGRVIARKVRLRHNAHRVADECSIDLPIEALPFAPVGIARSILVEVRKGMVSADDWAAAMSAGALGADGFPLSVQTLEALDPDFVGFADVHKVNFPASGGATVNLTCRDFAGVLADEAARGRVIETDVPIDEAIARFLGTIASMVGMSVVWLGPEDPPTIGDSMPKAKKKKSGKSPPHDSSNGKGSCLDLLADYCTLSGVVPTFVGYKLELASPRTLDQFSAVTVPKMVLGINIADLELEHRLTKAHARAVEVRSFNPDTGKLVVARYPPDSQRQGELAPGAVNDAPPTGPINLPPGTSGADERSAEVMIVRNVVNPKRLADIARNTFEEMARQDLAGKITTNDIATIEGRARGLPDLLTIRAGDPISIVIAPSIEQADGSFVQRLASMPEGDAVNLMIVNGYSPKVATRVVREVLQAGLPFLYRVREVDFTYDVAGSTEIEIQIINNVEVVDREFVGGNLGGNRASLPQGANFAQKWNAIDADMLAGELTPEQANVQFKRLADTEIDALGSLAETLP